MSAASQANPCPEVNQATGKKKRIIICCDGTGNAFVDPNVKKKEPGSGKNSNVVKFYTAVEVGKTASGVEQLAYYHPGVGTMGSPLATNWLEKKWTWICGLAFGLGFRDNVLDAYRYLMENYSDNGGDGNEDEVYMLGFSRGAYTARALAGLLHGYGLLCKGNEEHLRYAWRMYVGQHSHRGQREVKPDNAFRLTFSHKHFKIRFLGVWDTVSSVGWIYSPLILFNIAKNDTVQVARHAVSIDERRCFFTDNLWGEPAKTTDLLQVWFAGVHSDVGGSYDQDESGLSDITLRWMLEEAAKAGEAFRTDRTGDRSCDPELLQYHPDRLKLILGTPVPGSEYEGLLYKKPKHTILHNSLTVPWRVVEYLPHLYYDKDLGAYHEHGPETAAEEKDSAEFYRFPLGASRQIPDGALIHGSVKDFMEKGKGALGRKEGYKPKNLSPEQGTLKDTGETDGQGISYFRFEESAAHKARKKKAKEQQSPGWLFAAVHSKWIMKPIATVELIILFGVILMLAGKIALIFAVPLALLLGGVVHFLVCGFLWLFKVAALKLWGILPATVTKPLAHAWDSAVQFAEWIGKVFWRIVWWLWKHP